jgi:hypothetical protein
MATLGKAQPTPSRGAAAAIARDPVVSRASAASPRGSRSTASTVSGSCSAGAEGPPISEASAPVASNPARGRTQEPAEGSASTGRMSCWAMIPAATAAWTGPSVATGIGRSRYPATRSAALTTPAPSAPATTRRVPAGRAWAVGTTATFRRVRQSAAITTIPSSGSTVAAMKGTCRSW